MSTTIAGIPPSSWVFPTNKPPFLPFLVLINFFKIGFIKIFFKDRFYFLKFLIFFVLSINLITFVNNYL